MGLQRPGWGGWGRYSTLSALLAAIAMVFLTLSLRGREWTGLWQRVLLVVVFAWCATMGVRLFRGPPASDGG